MKTISTKPTTTITLEISNQYLWEVLKILTDQHKLSEMQKSGELKLAVLPHEKAQMQRREYLYRSPRQTRPCENSYADVLSRI